MTRSYFLPSNSVSNTPGRGLILVNRTELASTVTCGLLPGTNSCSLQALQQSCTYTVHHNKYVQGSYFVVFFIQSSIRDIKYWMVLIPPRVKIQTRKINQKKHIAHTMNNMGYRGGGAYSAGWCCVFSVTAIFRYADIFPIGSWRKAHYYAGSLRVNMNKVLRLVTYAFYTYQVHRGRVFLLQHHRGMQVKYYSILLWRAHMYGMCIFAKKYLLSVTSCIHS